MARSAPQHAALESILACRESIVILAGPARSGKTAAAMALYEHCMGPDGRSGCVLLVPNRLTVRRFRRDLLARAGGVLAAPAVMTFPGLAERILAAAHIEHRPISPVHRRVVLEGIVQDLHRRGELTRLAAVADTPGLLAALDRAIAELKRAAVDVDSLAAAVRGDGRHRDLLRIYSAYQNYLHAQRLYDLEGRMWQARSELSRLDRPALPQVRMLAADGFTDFTPTQLAILRLLAGGLEKLLVTLPLAEEPARTKLWHWTGRQHERMRHAFGAAACTLRAEDRDHGPMRQPLRLLFAPEAPAEACAEGLSIVSAAGIESECRAIARWARRHLRSGTDPDELLVIARDIDAYRPTLARVFAEARLRPPPVDEPLSQTPPARFLLTLLRMAEGFRHEDVLAVIGSSYFRPQRLGEFDARTPAVAQLLIRRGNIVGGRDSYARAAQRLALRVRPGGEFEEDEDFNHPLDRHLARLGREAIERSGRMFEALFEAVAPLAAGAPSGDMARACLELMRRLGLGQLPAPGPATEDLADELRATACLRELLEELAGLDGPGLLDRPMACGAFTDLLGSLLSQTPCPARRPPGSVLTASALDGRALSARHVWLAGLNEGVFPALPRDSALIQEADRLAWSAHGVQLDGRDDLTAREMLLFYLTVARAEESLTLSYLSCDADGRAQQPSEFLAAVLRAAGVAGPGAVQVLPPAEFAPPPQRIISHRELLNAAMAAASCCDAKAATPPALRLARTYLGQELRRIAPAMWASFRRWRRGPADAFDGALDDPALLADLRRRVPAQTLFSVSQINSYLACPWQHFARWQLKLTPLDEPSDQLVPRSRGLLAHAVLRRLMTLLAQDGQPADLARLDPDRLDEALEQALSAESAEALRFGAPYPVLWDSELHQLRRALTQSLRRQVELTSHMAQAGTNRWQAAHMELAFGLPTAPGADPASTPEPLVLDGPAGPVRLCGKIDRVDVLQDSLGQRRSFVVDYKTGHLPTDGSDVQLPVYIRAVERLLALEAMGGMFQAVWMRGGRDRLLAQFRLRRGQVQTDEAYAEKLQTALDSLHRAVGAMAGGAFPALPQRCAGAACPYRRACGYSPSRASFKTPEQPA